MRKVLYRILVLLLLCIINITFSQISEAAKSNKKSHQYKIKKYKINRYKSSEEKAATDQSDEYIPPQRIIEVFPYIGAIYGKDLLTGTLKDGLGWTAGLDVKFQIYENFGLVVDSLYSNFKTEEKVQTTDYGMLIFAGGFYYSFYDWKINLCYGAITADLNAMTIFMPGIEYSKNLTSRFSFFIKLNSLITNDWIVNEDYKEKYTSFMIASGISIAF